jgi:UDP-hydrolysing UDP-N-acetyl-D-glucosamine 2-epimerase
MTLLTGEYICSLYDVFLKNRPDIVVSVTDRYESLATAVAASMSGILLAHIQGGERTGSLDEAMRHAITKLAQIHFPANADAARRIIRMGEDPAHVHNVGCPATDLLLQVDVSTRPLHYPYILVAYNPVVTESDNREQMTNVLEACHSTGLAMIVVGPNHDPGAAEIVKADRQPEDVYFPTLPHSEFIRYMAHAAVMVGNSSAGIREAGYFGTPVVDVGTRQQDRLDGPNVLHAPGSWDLQEAIQAQLQHAKYRPQQLYGDGTAGVQIAEILATCRLPRIQKRMMY